MICLFWLMIQSPPSVAEILDRVDRNLVGGNRVIVSRMVIHGRRASRTITSKSWIEGETRAFTEYLAPAREKGTKMLKLEDQLWTYSPSTDRIFRISGHLLRQAVMGSDLSYEDMMEDSELKSQYTGVIAGEEAIDGRTCWILDLTAVVDDVAYYKRKIWVDQERFVPLKEQRFAKSGQLLKTTDIREVKTLDDRWVATHVIFKDELKQGKGTEFFLDEVEFDQEIPETVFSKASLRK